MNGTNTALASKHRELGIILGSGFGVTGRKTTSAYTLGSVWSRFDRLVVFY
jgi:hypothetical protein